MNKVFRDDSAVRAKLKTICRQKAGLQEVIALGFSITPNNKGSGNGVGLAKYREVDEKGQTEQLREMGSG